MNEKLNNILGGLLGVHAGDSLGAGVEFESRDHIRRSHPNMIRDITGGGMFGWSAGAPTDDTDLTLAVANGYLSNPDGGDQLIDAVAKNFLTWYNKGPVDVGNTTSSALSSYKRSGNPFTSGHTGSFTAANGSLMRTVPIGLARRLGDPRLLIEARQISAITHALPLCMEACVAYSVMVSALVEEKDTDQVLALGKKYCQSPEVIAAIEVAEKTNNIDDLPTPHGGYVLHALRVAVWGLAHDVSFEQGVMQAVYLGEDTDTNGAIAGGLLGSRDGVNQIPARWLDLLQAKTEMNKLGIALLAIRNEC